MREPKAQKKPYLVKKNMKFYGGFTTSIQYPRNILKKKFNVMGFL